YDRIAFDFRHDRAPGYTIGYVNQAIRDGSGEPVSLTGSNVLQIIFTPADAHTAEGTRTTDAPTNPRTTGYPGLQSYVMTGDFEAHVTFALGVSSRNGYQIRQFQNGDKWTVYVDIRH
ncbi:MAG: Zinc D-Ala-D-Ala carboxypeptidase, partial [Candidatus Saccharibacteria bacterium]|nr:Zinc D-Ala-D-Ala carboxypeptidase [Candidatus Saccharibacteria bacterium]